MAMKYDLLVRDGQIVNPGGEHEGRLDIGVRDGRIAAIEARIPDQDANEVISAAGLLVTPGLIDMHTHVYDKATFMGMNPEALAARTGVTTWVDAGSAGAFNLAGLHHHVADHAKVRILAFVNIAGIGLIAQDFEVSDLRWCSANLLVEEAKRHPDLVVGVKFRAGRAGAAKDLEPLRRAKRAATMLGKPLMVHISRQPPTLDEVLEHMGPGDILTHAFTGLDMKMLDDDGAVLESVLAARANGLLFDVGHGNGSFSWDSAEKLTATGIWPDTISTDIHQVAVWGPYRRGMRSDDSALGPFPAGHDAAGMLFSYAESGTRTFTLLECMSKFLHLGMSIDDVIRAVTATPARIVGRSGELGVLALGAPADVALLRVHDGPTELQDSKGFVRTVERTISCDATILGGAVLPQLDYEAPPPWVVALPE